MFLAFFLHSDGSAHSYDLIFEYVVDYCMLILPSNFCDHSIYGLRDVLGQN